MAEKWYLVAYDIADAKRLARVHRIMKKEGLAAQRSVFFARGTRSAVERLLDRLQTVMKGSEDDVRAYPVTSPGEVWTSGANPVADYPLFYLGRTTESDHRPEKQGKGGRALAFFKKLLAGNNGGK